MQRPGEMIPHPPDCIASGPGVPSSDHDIEDRQAHPLSGECFVSILYLPRNLRLQDVLDLWILQARAHCASSGVTAGPRQDELRAPGDAQERTQEEGRKRPSATATKPGEEEEGRCGSGRVIAEEEEEMRNEPNEP